MLTIIISAAVGTIVGGAIVFVFKDKIAAAEAEIVAAYRAEVAKLTAAHQTATVAAVKAVASV